MGEIGSIVLVLDETNATQSLVRRQPLERQDRSDQEQCLPEGQGRGFFLSRSWVRTRKWWAKRHKVM
jgi:hypothetical protein